MKDKWKNVKKAKFLNQLGILLEKGYSLSSAIELLSYQETKEIKLILHRLLRRLKEGESLYQTLEFYIPNDIRAYIYFSEKNGDLAFGLKEAGNIYLKKEEVKEKLQKLLKYPLFLFWLIFMIFLFMNHFLFPQFTALFHSMNGELPIITTVFLYGIDAASLFVPFSFLLLLPIFIYYVKKYRHYTPHKKVSLLMKVPFASSFIEKIITYYFCIQLSGLLKGGISIHDALTVFEEQDSLLFYQEEAKQLKSELIQGERLDTLISSREYFTKELPLIIAHGQHKGQLEMDLYHYSNLLFQTMEERIKQLLMIIQPVLFLIIGFIVFVIFLSIFLPVFQLIQTID